MYNVAIDFCVKSSKEYSAVHKVHFQYNTRKKAKNTVRYCYFRTERCLTERTIKYCSSQCHYSTDDSMLAAYCMYL